MSEDDTAVESSRKVTWLGEGSIVVFAKCPIPGKSKTRLIPLLGEDGSVQLAKSMLSDVLKTIDGCSELSGVRKILMFAPGTLDGRERMEGILTELGLVIREAETKHDNDKTQTEDFHAWHLLPMMSKTSDLQSHDLGSKLEDALVRVRELEGEDKGGVVFLGMDAPVLPLTDIVSGLERAVMHETATLCPAMDGGYAMLCVPPSAAPSRTFRDMYWSHPWTGMSQAKAITDQGIRLSIGSIVRDIDETDDVEELCHNLGIEIPPSKLTIQSMNGEKNTTKTAKKRNLELPSGRPPWLSLDLEDVTSSHPTCHFTQSVLMGAFASTNC